MHFFIVYFWNIYYPIWLAHIFQMGWFNHHLDMFEFFVGDFLRPPENEGIILCWVGWRFFFDPSLWVCFFGRFRWRSAKRSDTNANRNPATPDHLRPCLNVETWSSRKVTTTEAWNDPHNTHNVRSQFPKKQVLKVLPWFFILSRQVYQKNTCVSWFYRGCYGDKLIE